MHRSSESELLTEKLKLIRLVLGHPSIREQGFGEENPMLKNQVYRIDPDGTVDVVADKFQKPNGLAFSPDESRLYVTDTGYYSGCDPLSGKPSSNSRGTGATLAVFSGWGA